MALILAGISALFYGVADFSGGLAAARSRLLSVLILSQAMGLAVAVAGLAFMGHGLPPARDLGWGLLAGVTGALGLFMLYGGLARSLVAVVSPLSALVGAMIPVLFAIFLGERPTPNALAGCLLCLPAIFLLSWERGGRPQDRRLVRTAVTYGGLGGPWVRDVLPGHLPLPSRSRPVAPGRGPVRLHLCLPDRPARHPAAVPDGTGRARPQPARGRCRHDRQHRFPAWPPRAALLSLVAVITSLYPAPTVLLARVVLKQRIPPARLAGLVLALVGVGLISAGNW